MTKKIFQAANYSKVAKAVFQKSAFIVIPKHKQAHLGILIDP